MSMTQIQRDAMQQAQQGNWALADAIELQARLKTEGERDTDDTSADLLGGGGIGRLRYLVYGPPNADTACEECEAGVLVCGECGHESKCEDCDGTGTIRNPTDYLDWTEVLDLNGRVVWKHGDPMHECPVGELQYTADWAAGVIAEYEAGREQAPTQHPIIPEAA